MFQKDKTITRQNLDATNHLLDDFRNAGTDLYVWSDVSAKTILAFLREYKTHPHAPKVNSGLACSLHLQEVSRRVI